MIGTWFAIAGLFKTIALAMAVIMGLAHVLAPPCDGERSSAAKQVVIMAASGAICLAAVFGYFAVSGRFQIFWQVIVGSGPHYAAEGWAAALDSFVRLSPAGGRMWLVIALAIVPWIGVALLAWIDQDRRRSWVLLGAYAFSAAIAVALPGYFYAHYFQLLVPPLCLGFGWLATAFAKRGGAVLARGTPALVVLCLVVLLAFEARSYLMPAETALRNVGTARRGPLSGTYHQELYLETQKLGRRLGEALHGDEILYQWGEESGLYWYSGKRPPAIASRWVLISGPQAGRLTRQTLKSLMARPPDLVVVANSVLDHSRGHPVFEWVRSHYDPRRPIRSGERKFFTFFVPKDASADLVRRVGVDQASSAPDRGSQT
jgi:hypothetical protein